MNQMDDNFLNELNKFRADPSSVVDMLKRRRDRYHQIDNQIYLASSKYKKKMIQLKEQQEPKKKIQELIGVLCGQITQSLNRLKSNKSLTDLAERICDGINDQMCQTQSINFKSDTQLILRKVLQDDEKYQYPDQVYCLISISFNEQDQPLASLLVDDDNPERSNRTVLLKPDLNYVGFSSTPISACKCIKCTVMLLTTQIVAK